MGHVLYTAADFTNEEIERGGALVNAVIDGGLGVCKKCGAAEIELDKPCQASAVAIPAAALPTSVADVPEETARYFKIGFENLAGVARGRTPPLLKEPCENRAQILAEIIVGAMVSAGDDAEEVAQRVVDKLVWGGE